MEVHEIAGSDFERRAQRGGPEGGEGETILTVMARVERLARAMTGVNLSPSPDEYNRRSADGGSRVSDRGSVSGAGIDLGCRVLDYLIAIFAGVVQR